MEEQKGKTKENSRSQGTITMSNGGITIGCDDRAQMGRRVIR